MGYLTQLYEASAAPHESMNSPNLQCAQAFMNWATSLLTIGHQKRASILNKVICSCICTTMGYTWHAYIKTNLNLMGTTTSLSCPTLDMREVS